MGSRELPYLLSDVDSAVPVRSGRAGLRYFPGDEGGPAPWSSFHVRIGFWAGRRHRPMNVSVADDPAEGREALAGKKTVAAESAQPSETPQRLAEEQAALRRAATLAIRDRRLSATLIRSPCTA